MTRYEVVMVGIDENLQKVEEVYTTCDTIKDAKLAAGQLRHSMIPMVILIREQE